PPLTPALAPSTVTSPPLGKGIGVYPIRLNSPTLTHDLAAETTATRLTVRHQTLARGDHGHADAALDTRQLRGAPVDAVTRTGHAAQTEDGRAATLAVPEHELQRLRRALTLDLVAVDETLGDEDLCDADLHLRRRHAHALVTDRNR